MKKLINTPCRYVNSTCKLYQLFSYSKDHHMELCMCNTINNKMVPNYLVVLKDLIKCYVCFMQLAIKLDQVK